MMLLPHVRSSCRAARADRQSLASVSSSVQHVLLLRDGLKDEEVLPYFFGANFDVICRLFPHSTKPQQLLFSAGYKQQRKNGKGKWRANRKRNLQELWGLPKPLADEPVEALAGSAAAA